MTGSGDGDQRQLFEVWTEPHLDALYRFAARRVGAGDEAEDVVQDACLKAYRAFGQFEPGTDYRAWLFRILVNTLADRHRRSARSVSVVSMDAFGAGEADLGSDAPVAIPSPERELLARSQLTAVQRAFEELPADWQMILHLSVVDGVSYKQIAGILDCPAGTVMSRLYRSRRVLAGRLAAFLGGEADDGRPGGRPRTGLTPLAQIRERVGRHIRERRGTTS